MGHTAIYKKFYHQGNIYCQSHDYKSALTCFIQAKQECKKSIKNAQSLSNEKEKEQAEKDLVDIYKKCVFVCCKQKEFDDARYYLLQAGKINGFDSELLWQLGYVYYQFGKYRLSFERLSLIEKNNEYFEKANKLREKAAKKLHKDYSQHNLHVFFNEYFAKEKRNLNLSTGHCTGYMHLQVYYWLCSNCPDPQLHHPWIRKILLAAKTNDYDIETKMAYELAANAIIFGQDPKVVLSHLTQGNTAEIITFLQPKENNRKIQTEYNSHMIFHPELFNKFLQLISDNRVIVLGAQQHSIAIFRCNNKFYAYDSNYPKTIPMFELNELIDLSNFVQYAFRIENYNECIPMEFTIVTGQKLIKDYQRKISCLITNFLQKNILSPIDDQAHVNYANVFYKLKNYEQAYFHCQRALKINPANLNALVLRDENEIIEEEERQNQLKIDKKLNNFKQLIMLDPKKIDLRFAYAEFLIDLGQAVQALNVYTEVISMDKKNAEVYYKRGLLYDGMGCYQQAINDYTKAIELDPANKQDYLELRQLARMLLMNVTKCNQDPQSTKLSDQQNKLQF